MSLRPHGTMPGRTYKFLDETKLAPVWRFGHGYSYTTFELLFVQTPGRCGPRLATVAHLVTI